ncbi:MAG TPA: CDP-diacylglycerol--glycerol-3-phosphate 3-phosphatidyltransferase [Micromonosporaceae bacterium]|nr:CDP-diacylglycerol--glycerol-3-phosphate 3-phosphatidyltransferase [Micromonosporaceae bacterium]
MATQTSWHDRLLRWLLVGMFQAGTRGGTPTTAGGRIVTVPNAITLVRLLCLPLYGLLVLRHHAWVAAILLAWGLAVLDAVDGYVARRLRQVSVAGTMFDPLVDRFSIAVFSVTGAMAHAVPPWICVAIVSRDLMLLPLLPSLIRTGAPVKVSRIGKLASLTLAFALPGMLVTRSVLPGTNVWAVVATVVTVTGMVLYFWSLAGYLGQGFGFRR